MDPLDHRALGRRLELFHQEDDSPGMVFWHPKGTLLWRVLEDHIRLRMRELGFAEVRSPVLQPMRLWERSGHAEKFADGMFIVGEGERAMALKPMSCPCHARIFQSRRRSWRELPLRYAELGLCHRDEPSGAVLGLMRTRAFVQDDAHLFCEERQAEGEVLRFCGLLRRVYAELGFPRFRVALSTRPPRRAGDDRLWDRAEAILAGAARAAGLDHAVQPGEGAFYGPKLEFILEDARGRSWQCGTVQLDYVLPERLDLAFVGREDDRVRPVMIHHAVLGSLERFIGVLLEHHGLELPFWLAPEQVSVLPVADGQQAYAAHVADELGRAGLRASVEAADERLPRRILAARERGVPVLAVVGAAEAAAGTVALRWRDGRRLDLALGEAVAVLRRQAGPDGTGMPLAS